MEMLCPPYRRTGKISKAAKAAPWSGGGRGKWKRWKERRWKRKKLVGIYMELSSTRNVET